MVQSMIEFGYNDQDIAFVMNINVPDVKRMIQSGSKSTMKTTSVSRRGSLESALPGARFRTHHHSHDGITSEV